MLWAGFRLTHLPFSEDPRGRQNRIAEQACCSPSSLTLAGCRWPHTASCLLQVIATEVMKDDFVLPLRYNHN